MLTNQSCTAFPPSHAEIESTHTENSHTATYLQIHTEKNQSDKQITNKKEKFGNRALIS